jgi:hypothetical protein
VAGGGHLPPALPKCRMSIAPSGHLTRVAEEWVDATSPLVRLHPKPRPGAPTPASAGDLLLKSVWDTDYPRPFVNV